MVTESTTAQSQQPALPARFARRAVVEGRSEDEQHEKPQTHHYSERPEQWGDSRNGVVYGLLYLRVRRIGDVRGVFFQQQPVAEVLLDLFEGGARLRAGIALSQLSQQAVGDHAVAYSLLMFLFQILDSDDRRIGRSGGDKPEGPRYSDGVMCRFILLVRKPEQGE